ncbi:MAG: hypothetical protein L7S59_00855 [Pseudomonadales bacterium]|nr:hypothetical protein [Pseudomonadales bacterium]
MTRVLMPIEMKETASLPAGFDALYYAHRNPRFFERVKHKLSKSKPDVFKYKIIVKNSLELKNVKALWLSAKTVLSQRETEQFLEHMTSLQWAYSQRTGIDHLALSSFQNRGIKVSTTGDLVSAWVAQMNLACILSDSKMLPTHLIKQRAFRSEPSFCKDVSDLRVAIAGTGNIGNQTAAMCRALGMTVIGVSNHLQERDLGGTVYHEVYDATDIDMVLPDIDYLVLALPLTEQTKGFIDKAKLTKLRKTACLINLARPQLADENALLLALKSNQLATAYVSGLQDVSRIQRILANRLPNLLITHYSDAHLNKKKRIAFQQFSSGLINLREGREVDNRIV